MVNFLPIAYCILIAQPAMELTNVCRTLNLNIPYTFKKHIHNIHNLPLHFHMASNRLSPLFLQRASFF